MSLSPVPERNINRIENRHDLNTQDTETVLHGYPTADLRGCPPVGPLAVICVRHVVDHVEVTDQRVRGPHPPRIGHQLLQRATSTRASRSITKGHPS